MNGLDLPLRIQQRFLVELRHHFKGWLAKVNKDSSETAFRIELEGLLADPLYSSFGLATAEYALVRIMGRLSISIGRRLGEIYDKIPRFVTQARFNLTAADVAPKMAYKPDAALELDVCVPLDKLTRKDRRQVVGTVTKYIPSATSYTGLQSRLGTTSTLTTAQGYVKTNKW